MMTVIPTLNTVNVVSSFFLLHLAVAASLDKSVYEVVEGVSVSLCVNLSNDIERNVVINIAMFDGGLINSATSAFGKTFFFL